ncbi:MAG: arginine--tRNA ligase [bacterium]
MKQQLQTQILDALTKLHDEGVLPEIPAAEQIELTRTKDVSHGDFACNISLRLAKPAKKNPRELAQLIVSNLSENSHLDRTEIAGPGFINFFLNSASSVSVIDTILQQKHQYGRSSLGKGKKVQVEFVSANPTGPLHVGHGRGAAYGAAVADLLDAVGFEVHREYYVNDAGRQMDILGTSVWLRYLELCGEELTFPANGYKGDYVWDIAATLHREEGDTYRHSTSTVFSDIPADEPAGGDKELHIDALIEKAKSLLGEAGYRKVFDLGLNTLVDDIRDDLKLFGIEYENWYSERSLVESGAVNRALQRLDTAGHLYEQNGAIWFRSTNFGDEKDRVVKRDNGQTTYFASDIAYHMEKFERGFERVIDVWGADHHGYVPRVKAALEALGENPAKLDVLLVQFAILYKGGERMQMSTRSGQFVTLRELRKEVGSDAARFFYVMRRCEQHLDFDLDLAKSQSSDNPMYYIQYAHARICSVQRQVDEQGIQPRKPDYGSLTESHETELMKKLAIYPEIVEKAALNEEPHQIVHYLRELANLFHTYYNAHKFMIDDVRIRDARLALCEATQHVLKNGLQLLGVSAPQKM